jgi:hypothetical protein
MKAVSNSSVLIALSSIGQLELINQRFPDSDEPISGKSDKVSLCSSIK